MFNTKLMQSRFFHVVSKGQNTSSFCPSALETRPTVSSTLPIPTPFSSLVSIKVTFLMRSASIVNVLHNQGYIIGSQDLRLLVDIFYS